MLEIRFLIATIVPLVVLVLFVNAESSQTARELENSELFPEDTMKEFTHDMQMLAEALPKKNVPRLIIRSLEPTRHWSSMKEYFQLYDNCNVSVLDIQIAWDHVYKCLHDNCHTTLDAKFGGAMSKREYKLGVKLNTGFFEISGEHSRSWERQVNLERTDSQEVTLSRGESVVPIEVFAGLTCDAGVYRVSVYCRPKSSPVNPEVQHFDNEVECVPNSQIDDYCLANPKWILPPRKPSESERCFYRASEKVTYRTTGIDCCKYPKKSACNCTPDPIKYFPKTACGRVNIPLLSPEGNPIKQTVMYIYKIPPVAPK
jgi:hypothetical protein